MAVGMFPRGRWTALTYQVDRLNVRINGQRSGIAYVSPKFPEGIERYNGNSHTPLYGD
jgi:hypothetical protein